jgi:hypothetical protein
MSSRKQTARFSGIEAKKLPRPIEIKRGGVYVIESAETLTADSFADISAYLKTFSEATGCEFLILDHGLKLAMTEAPHD